MRAKYFMSDDSLRKLWAQQSDAILAKWIEKSPGTRPTLWWQFEAPESARKRLGGKGVVEAFCGYQFGLPDSWRTEGFDPRDPPRFESQSAYLKRHALLLPNEAARPHALDEALPRALWPE